MCSCSSSISNFTETHLHCLAWLCSYLCPHCNSHVSIIMTFHGHYSCHWPPCQDHCHATVKYIQNTSGRLWWNDYVMQIDLSVCVCAYFYYTQNNYALAWLLWTICILSPLWPTRINLYNYIYSSTYSTYYVLHGETSHTRSVLLSMDESHHSWFFSVTVSLFSAAAHLLVYELCFNVLHQLILLLGRSDARGEARGGTGLSGCLSARLRC